MTTPQDLRVWWAVILGAMMGAASVFWALAVLEAGFEAWSERVTNDNDV